MILGDAQGIAQPYGDFVDAASAAGEQAGKGVPHGMRRDPRQSAGGDMGAKRAFVVSAVFLLWPGVFGVQHVGGAQSVGGEEVAKRFGERDGAGLAVFGNEPVGFLEGEGAVAEVEPTGAGLHDLGFAQAGMETGEEDVAQGVVGGLADEQIAFGGGAEAHGRTGGGAADGNGGGGGVGEPAGGDAPAEEGADIEHVALGGDERDAGLELVEPGLDLLGGDAVCVRVSEVEGKAVEGDAMGARGGARVGAVGEAFGDEGGGVGAESERGIIRRGTHKGGGAVDGLDVVGGLEGGPDAAAVVLMGEPVGFAAEIDAPKFTAGSCHSGLSQLGVQYGPTWAYMRMKRLANKPARCGWQLYQKALRRRVVTVLRHSLSGVAATGGVV